MRLGDLTWAYEDVEQGRPKNLGDRPFNPKEDHAGYDDDSWDDDDDDWEDTDDEWGVELTFDED